MNRLTSLLLTFFLIFSLTGCGGHQNETESTKELVSQEEAVVKKTEEEVEDAGEEVLEEEDDETETEEEALSAFASFSGDYISDYGGLGMSSQLTLYESGYFEGYFQDANMGETGEENPRGTVYRSEFTGSLSDLEDNGDGTYTARIDFIEPLGVRGDYEIEDGVKKQVTDKIPPFEGAYFVTLTEGGTIVPDGFENVTYSLL